MFPDGLFAPRFFPPRMFPRSGFPPGFSQSTITDLRLLRAGHDFLVSWTSSAPTGTVFQVYVGRRLTWYGTARAIRLPSPQGLALVEVGAVGATEGPTDFSGSLPSAPTDRVSLSWLGGSFLKAGLASYAIYAGTAPGGSVSFTAPIARIPTYSGTVTDGYGLGGWNQGGYGQSAARYSWTSGPLPAGVWSFAISPLDAAGNQIGSPTPVTATVAAPPRAPAPNADGSRLTYTYNGSTHVATLHWNGSGSGFTPTGPTGP